MVSIKSILFCHTAFLDCILARRDSSLDCVETTTLTLTSHTNSRSEKYKEVNTNRDIMFTTKKDMMLQAKLPLLVADANVTSVERKVPTNHKLITVGRGAPGGDPLFDASLGMEHATGEDDSLNEPLTANVSMMARRIPIITDKFVIVGLNDKDCDGDVSMPEASEKHHQEYVPDKGMVRKLPLTVDDTHVSNMKRQLPNAVAKAQVGGDPILEAYMAQHTGPRGGVVRKLPLTAVDARVSDTMERGVPPPPNPIQDRGEPVGDPLLDATLEEQEEQDITTTDEDMRVHLDARRKMKSKFPCTSVVYPEDVHREVGPPMA